MDASRLFDGRFLIRGGRAETVEGRSQSRCAVIEFLDYEAALSLSRVHRSKGFAAGESVGDVIVTEAYDGVQPWEGSARQDEGPGRT